MENCNTFHLIKCSFTFYGDIPLIPLSQGFGNPGNVEQCECCGTTLEINIGVYGGRVQVSALRHNLRNVEGECIAPPAPTAEGPRSLEGRDIGGWHLVCYDEIHAVVFFVEVLFLCRMCVSKGFLCAIIKCCDLVFIILHWLTLPTHRTLFFFSLETLTGINCRGANEKHWNRMIQHYAFKDE